MNQNNQSFGGVEYYDLSVFNSNEWVAQCLLFRVPKTIHILPSYTFHNLRIFSPYLRTAEEIEFCDLFLFESAKFFESETNFVFEVLSLCKESVKVKIHCRPNPTNISQRKFEKEIKNRFRKIKFDGFFKYNLPNKNVNHDRFIIVNLNEYSIRFTSSFNNLSKNADGSYEI